MAEIELISIAELNAEKAENLKAFSGLKLLHVKKQVAIILNQIGRDGIFDEYTKHDISHIDFMLKSLEFIIPTQTAELMTPADWMMITLSIYFHDLGMLVTKQEFKDRESSSFSGYKNEILKGEHGLDYKDKILSLTSGETQDRFIYQELVRKTHAERIRFWILDEPNPKFPQLEIVQEIKKLIGNLDVLFRRDLALICESHHLSDLDDLEKYKVNQQYGPTDLEVVNLQYSAILLRTADLLHITSDRTPSIEFNLINPTDPISQEEWAKQRAVKAVRAKVKKNSDNIIDPNIPKDTFEVIAFFEDEKGFFGLISYLNYANKQIKLNNKYHEIAVKQGNVMFEYPWRSIDDSSIETKDFEKRQFEFVLDQTRILDLLVGHTLYNDSSVVLRELIQNSIDACKLMAVENSSSINSTSYAPKINIDWKERSRELIFEDNGTGMSLEIIQNHLLKVGSSRYQDESFKKKYPEFSAISRFGIGLLTCFLVADDIDILTKSYDSDRAILLKIKKIHGKYLLKYVSQDKLPDGIKQHGTSITLHVRADVDLQNIEAEIRKWIVIPKCELTLTHAGKTIKIGESSPAETLTSHLTNLGFEVDNLKIKVNQVEKNGTALAFALKYIEHLKEWIFLEYNDIGRGEISPIGICIEGIKVDFNTPGFTSKNLFAIANATGVNAPKTNVARSNIEATHEREELLADIYSLYLEHISSEIQNLRKAGFSITWAASEGNWLLRSLSRQSRYSRHPEFAVEDLTVFNSALSRVECLLMEENGERSLTSIDSLKNKGHFWTIDCASYSSADSLIKEVKSSNTSALALLKTIFGVEESNTNHIDTLLCNLQVNDDIDKIIGANFQIDAIKIVPDQRRLDLKWTLTTEKLWEEIELLREDHSSSSQTKCYVQLKDFPVDSSVTQIAIKSSNALFILKNSELNVYLIKLISELEKLKDDGRLILSQIIGILNSFFYYKDKDVSEIESFLDRKIANTHRISHEGIWEIIDKQELISTIIKTDFIKYDTTIWYRRDLF